MPATMEDALANREVRVLLATARRDRAALSAVLAEGVVHSRAIIRELKNRPDELDFFLGILGKDPGAGSYFYHGVTDNRTFDIYQKHHIAADNLDKDVVTPAQWQYLLSIGYVHEYDADGNPVDGPETKAGAETKSGDELDVEEVDTESEDGADSIRVVLCSMCNTWLNTDTETCIDCSGIICIGCFAEGYCVGRRCATVAYQCVGCDRALCANCAATCDLCSAAAASACAYCAKCRAGPLTPISDGSWRCRTSAPAAPDPRCNECGAQRSTMIECSECETAHFCVQCASKHHCNCGTTICASCVCSMCDGRGPTQNESRNGGSFGAAQQL